MSYIDQQIAMAEAKIARLRLSGGHMGGGEGDFRPKTSRGRTQQAPAAGLGRRTFSSEKYEKLLAKPNLPHTQRKQIEKMMRRRLIKESYPQPDGGSLESDRAIAQMLSAEDDFAEPGEAPQLRSPRCANTPSSMSMF